MATTTTETEKYLSLKLTVNEESNKVLFAEAGKDFVDVLFSFLTFPLGTIARLVEKDSNTGPVTIGCLNTLYRSVKDLDQSCLWDETVKQMLLQPSNVAEGYCNTLKLNIDDSQPTKFYKCSNPNLPCSLRYLTTLKNAKLCCETCGGILSLTSKVLLKHFHKGFVNDIATFVITDNLAVMPNSIDDTCFNMLEEFGIKNPSSVKEMDLNLSKQKVLDLLKCSLLSKATLTDLFLEKKPSLGISSLFSVAEIKGNVQIIIKLVIKKSDGKVLYAQGEQDFANLLLSFLTFPLGGVVRVLGANSSLGSVDALYKSITDLNENKYFLSNEAKKRLVYPCISPKLKLNNQIFTILETGVVVYYRYDDFSGDNLQYFKAGEEMNYLSNLTKIEISNWSLESYVKGLGMYYATDDLVVAPLSPVSALGLLNRIEIPLDDLREKVVTIGVTDCLRILKAALTSTSALTIGLAHLLTEVKEDK